MNRESKIIRRSAFAVSISLMLVLYVVMDWLNYYPDVNNPLIVYGIEIFFLSLCAGFYTWWGIHNKHATSIYNWMTILLYCMIIDSLLEFYARYLYIYDRLLYSKYIMSFIWYFRSIPKIIAIIYMASLVIGRIIASKHNDMSENRE